MSDHGENLGEHGFDYNHHGVYDTVVLEDGSIAWDGITRV